MFCSQLILQKPLSITNILTNTGVTDVTPCIDTTDIPSIGTSGIIPNIGITYIIPSIVIIDTLPLCPMNNCYPAKRLSEEILTLNREKHHQLLEVKNQRNLTNLSSLKSMRLSRPTAVQHISEISIVFTSLVLGSLCIKDDTGRKWRGSYDTITYWFPFL